MFVLKYFHSATSGFSVHGRRKERKRQWARFCGMVSKSKMRLHGRYCLSNQNVACKTVVYCTIASQKQLVSAAMFEISKENKLVLTDDVCGPTWQGGAAVLQCQQFYNNRRTRQMLSDVTMMLSVLPIGERSLCLQLVISKKHRELATAERHRLGDMETDPPASYLWKVTWRFVCARIWMNSTVSIIAKNSSIFGGHRWSNVVHNGNIQ